MLAGAVGLKTFSLDDFWIRTSPKVYREGYRSFERPELYDGGRLHGRLSKASATVPVLAEGFLLFRYPEIWNVLTHRFFIELPDSEILARRATRRSAGMGGSRSAEAGFEAIGLAEWRDFGSCQAAFPGVTKLDGMLPLPKLAAAILVATNLDAGLEPRIQLSA